MMRIQICNWAYSRMGLWGFGVLESRGHGITGLRRYRKIIKVRWFRL